MQGKKSTDAKCKSGTAEISSHFRPAVWDRFDGYDFEGHPVQIRVSFSLMRAIARARSGRPVEGIRPGDRNGRFIRSMPLMSVKIGAFPQFGKLVNLFFGRSTMLTLPNGIMSIWITFAPFFSTRLWPHVQVLVMGAVLATGKRTVTAVLRMMGRSPEKQFQKYHRVLNRAAWLSIC